MNRRVSLKTVLLLLLYVATAAVVVVAFDADYKKELQKEIDFVATEPLTSEDSISACASSGAPSRSGDHHDACSKREETDSSCFAPTTLKIDGIATPFIADSCHTSIVAAYATNILSNADVALNNHEQIDVEKFVDDDSEKGRKLPPQQQDKRGKVPRTASSYSSSSPSTSRGRGSSSGKRSAAPTKSAALGGGSEAVVGGRRFSSIKDFWERELLDKSTGQPYDLYDVEKGWYGRVQSFWASEPPTVDGVLGNSTGKTHIPDIRETLRFLLKLQEKGDTTTPKSIQNKKTKQSSNDFSFSSSLSPIKIGKGRALDVGVGMGRVSENILVKRFDKIDVIESSPKMLEVATGMLNRHGKLGKVYNTSIERVVLPAVPTYDLVVMQWVSMYLTDNDLVAFLKQAKAALRNGTVRIKNKGTVKGKRNDQTQSEKKEVAGTAPEEAREMVAATRGFIFLKENIAWGQQFLVGSQDLSINRCDAHYKALFKLAGLRVIAEAPQVEWPSGYLPVRMYALV